MRARRDLVGLAGCGSWPRWNAGVVAIVLHGDFATGGRFDMTLPDGTVVTSTLTEVVPDRRFVDETLVRETIVQVRHDIKPRCDGGCRIAYATKVTGPDAADLGRSISADFPDVLTLLKSRAEA